MNQNPITAEVSAPTPIPTRPTLYQIVFFSQARGSVWSGTIPVPDRAYVEKHLRGLGPTAVIVTIPGSAPENKGKEQPSSSPVGKEDAEAVKTLAEFLRKNSHPVEYQCNCSELCVKMRLAADWLERLLGEPSSSDVGILRAERDRLQALLGQSRGREEAKLGHETPREVRMQACVNLAAMLIQPHHSGGIELEGALKFRRSLMMAARSLRTTPEEFQAMQAAMNAGMTHPPKAPEGQSEGMLPPELKPIGEVHDKAWVRGIVARERIAWRKALSSQSKEIETLRKSGDDLCSAILTVRQQNMPEWMEYIVEKINAYCERAGHAERWKHDKREDMLRKHPEGIKAGGSSQLTQPSAEGGGGGA